MVEENPKNLRELIEGMELNGLVFESVEMCLDNGEEILKAHDAFFKILKSDQNAYDFYCLATQGNYLNPREEQEYKNLKDLPVSEPISKAYQNWLVFLETPIN